MLYGQAWHAYQYLLCCYLYCLVPRCNRPLPTACPPACAAEECVWIKVAMYNPKDVGRAAELLRVRPLPALPALLPAGRARISRTAYLTACRLCLSSPPMLEGLTAPLPCLHPCACYQGGAVLGRPWQPHESHLAYLLQLKIDFNLAGMGWLRLSHARFRWVMCWERPGTSAPQCQKS